MGARHSRPSIARSMSNAHRPSPYAVPKPGVLYKDKGLTNAPGKPVQSPSGTGEQLAHSSTRLQSLRDIFKMGSRTVDVPTVPSLTNNSASVDDRDRVKEVPKSVSEYTLSAKPTHLPVTTVSDDAPWQMRMPPTTPAKMRLSAPLADSEPSLVGESPMVEIQPGGFSLQNSAGSSSKIPMPRHFSPSNVSKTYAQARLQPATMKRYTYQQKLIYDDSPVKNEVVNFPESAALQDSGIGRYSEGSVSASDQSSNTSGKVTSPESSTGLIDDDFRDQPDLSVSYRRPPGTPNRAMIESYDSTLSGYSLDEDDCMLDFELSSAGVHDLPASVVEGGGSLTRRSGSYIRRRRSLKAMMANRPESVTEELTDMVNSIVLESVPVGGDNNKKPMRLRPSVGSVISEDGLSLEDSVAVDPHVYRYLVQDVTVIKTLLLRLRRHLQDVETVNPFESSVSGRFFSESAATGDGNLRAENDRLRMQVQSLLNELEQKNKLIEHLQTQSRKSSATAAAAPVVVTGSNDSSSRNSSTIWTDV